MVPVIAPYPQDGLEMKPFTHMKMPVCLASTVPDGIQPPEEGIEEDETPTPAQPVCCQDSRDGANSDCVEDTAEFHRGTARHCKSQVSK